MKHELIETENNTQDIINKIKELDIKKAILFCNKKRDIQTFVDLLKAEGFEALALHNGLEESERDETVKKFNEIEEFFLVSSDSTAKKVKLDKIGFVIGTEPPTRANDFKIRLSYLSEEGRGFTFHGKDSNFKLDENSNIVFNKPKEAKNNIARNSKPVANKKPTKEGKWFENGHVPSFLKIDISNLLKGRE